MLARAVAEELAAVGVPVLLGVRPVEGRVPLLLGLRSEAERTAVADRVAAALRAGVERAGHAARRARSRRSWWSGVAGGWAAAVGGPAARGGDGDGGAGACRTGPGTTPAAWTSTCCCGGCGTTRTWRPSWTARSARCAPTTARSQPPLLPTLETYLAHAGRKAETARELHLNRQTLYNRLARIGELLGTRPGRPADGAGPEPGPAGPQPRALSGWPAHGRQRAAGRSCVNSS